MASTFEEYVTVRGAALVRFARVLSGDRHRGEDLVQEVLARAYLRWEHIARHDDPDVYVRQAIVNATRSWWRRRPNREIPTELSVDHASPADVGSELVERDELWDRIRSLPSRQRAVLVLRYYEDLDDDTIAAILGCSRTTVRGHAMRALGGLREHYRPAPALTARQNTDTEGDTNG